MSDLIRQKCESIEKLKENGDTGQDGFTIFDEIHTELVRLQASDTGTFHQQLFEVTRLLLDNVLTLNETIVNFFINCFIRLLKKWQESTDFNDTIELKIFDNLASIIEYSDYLMNEELIQETNRCLVTIARVGKTMFTHQNITVITRLLRAYTTQETNRRYSFMGQSRFDDTVVKCVCSPYSIEVFAQLKLSSKSDDRSVPESFVFEGLCDHITFMGRDELQEQALTLRKNLLPSISDLVDAFVIAPDQWSTSALTILTDLTTLFLYCVQLTIPDDVCLDTQKHICDSAIRLLLLPTYRSMKLNNNCLQYVYMGTANDKTLDYLKPQSLTSTMFKIADLYKTENEIQFNVYRILAAIMTEEDIKKLDDPGSIAKVFLDHLEEIKDRSGWETRLKNLLTSLKSLLQHDQIRDEIYKQNGIPLFIYCGTTPRYEPLIKQRAIENLLIMSFNKSAYANLKENVPFMSDIKSLSENSSQPDVQRAAESLFWVLTKDEASKESTDSQSSTPSYDIMISYSHKDQELCFQIHDRLVKDKFRVWLDRDQMYGTPLEAMSQAIENAEFVLVCMSDTYKQSGYCKMEAYYALERQCSIIPLVMKQHFKADGWLGIIVTGRMRIDFPKHGFEEAYKKLLVEINRSRKDKKNQNQTGHHETPSTTKLTAKKPSQESKQTEKPVLKADSNHTLPVNIENWTNKDVEQFFLKQHLESFLPICSRMTGKNLFRLYDMCVMNSPVMFQSLNNQLAVANSDLDKSTIEIIQYLQFMDDLKPFVPIRMENRSMIPSQSSVCVVL